MYIECTSCHGSGLLISDCPYCRDSDDFEHEHLRPGPCPACKGHGYLEETCPVCGGAGRKKTKAPSVAKASSF